MVLLFVALSVVIDNTRSVMPCSSRIWNTIVLNYSQYEIHGEAQIQEEPRGIPSPDQENTQRWP